MPQVLFVQGNELNLSGGKLTVNGKEVDLTDKDVQVTGYDKDKLGEQTLTVTYKGKVHVAARYGCAARADGGAVPVLPG